MNNFMDDMIKNAQIREEKENTAEGIAEPAEQEPSSAEGIAEPAEQELNNEECAAAAAEEEQPSAGQDAETAEIPAEQPIEQPAEKIFVDEKTSVDERTPVDKKISVDEKTPIEFQEKPAQGDDTKPFIDTGPKPAGSEAEQTKPQAKPESRTAAPESRTAVTAAIAAKRHSADPELEALIAQARARIKIVGSGGAGNNTVTRMSEVKIAGTQTIAINTDAQDLLYAVADEKLLIGRELTKGLGAGSVPKIGEESARESEREIRDALNNSDMVFVTCGLGGGTGTGSAPIIAEISKKLGSLTIGVVTLPFTMEGKRRIENAIAGLEKLQNNVDTLIVIPNDRLLDLAPELPLHTAFKVADEILTNAVKGIVELITKPGLVNLDFADVKAVMSNGGVALIGIGESESENRAVECVERAIFNPLLDVDIAGATGTLINIIGGNDMTLEDARKAVENVTKRVDTNARIIWGAQIEQELHKTMRALIIVTGLKSSEVWASGKKASDKRKREMETHLGIPFVDIE